MVGNGGVKDKKDENDLKAPDSQRAADDWLVEWTMWAVYGVRRNGD